MKKFLSFILVLCLLVTLCACKGGDSPKKDGGKISVVTTIYPLYDFVRAVAGDRTDIKLLIAPATEVHSYDPSPSDIAAIYDCDLFVYIGGESDGWVDRILGDINVVSLKMLNTVPLIAEEGEHGFDEHIWTSPENAVSMVNTICENLCDIDEQNTEFFKENCKNYTNSIRAVQSDIRDTVQKSADKFILVADRFPFRYFTEEFGINYKAAFGGCATSSDISLKVMGELTKAVKDRGLSAAYYTEMSNRTVADALAEETGVKLYELHSAHNVTADDFAAGITYVDIMKRNLNALLKGMK